MRRHITLCLALASGMLALGSIGCTVAPPSTAFAEHQDAGTQQQQQQQTQPDLSPVAPAVVHAPVLGTYTTRTNWDTVPIPGTADPNVTILITSSDGTVLDTQADGNGNFCKDVSLASGQLNTFTIQAVNSAGMQSAQVTAAVTQTGQPQTQQQTSTTAQDVAKGGMASAYYIGVDGSTAASAVIDGDTTSSYEAEYDTTWIGANPNPYIQVQLSAESTINQIVVTAASDCLFNSTMPTVYYSDQDAPTAPASGASGWTPASGTLSADNLTFTANIPQSRVQYIAVVWPVPVRGSFDIGWTGGCGTANNGTFGLAEIAAMTVPNVAPPAPVAPSCGGGG